MITTKLKDRIVAILHTTFTEINTTVNVNLSSIAQLLKIRKDEVEVVLDQLETMGLLSSRLITHTETLVSANGSFFDFFNHGSFAGKEAIAELELERLKLEVLSLEGSIPGDVTKRLLDRIELVSKLFLMATGLNNS